MNHTSRRDWLDHFCTGLLYYYLTSLIAVGGVVFGHEFVRPTPRGESQRGDLLAAFANWDGRWYQEIAEQGYRYDPEKESTVAFFPAFPLLGRAVAGVTGWRMELCLLVVAHGALAMCFVMLAAYVEGRGGGVRVDGVGEDAGSDMPTQSRGYGTLKSDAGCDAERRGRAFPRGAWEREERVECTQGLLGSSPHPRPLSPEGRGETEAFTLLAFGLVPTTFFLRMAYGEALFVLAALVALVGIQRRWALVWVAVVVGFATATRPVGVALLLPLGWAIWQRSGSVGMVLVRCLGLLPLGCWGLLAYMVWQGWMFGEPLAFALTQEHWRVRPAVAGEERIVALVTLQPVWSIFDPGSPCYWCSQEGNECNPLFSMVLANPFYLAGAVALLVVGAWRRWLNTGEVLLGAALLLIPYVTRSHEMCLASMGRFVAAAVPIYLVLGQLLARLPGPVAVALLAVSGALLGAYAALFAGWHRVF